MAKKQSDDKDESKHSTLGVSKDIAIEVRDVAAKVGSTSREITDQLLRYALDQSDVEIEVRTVKLNPSGRKTKSS